MAELGQREATIWEQYGLHVERGKEALGARQRDSVPTDFENSDSLEVKGVKKTRFLIAGFCDEELMLEQVKPIAGKANCVNSFVNHQRK